jgi:Flp pilus assembly pilin Flp
MRDGRLTPRKEMKMTFPRPLSGRGRRKESGAAAVEFALVSTLLFPLMLGIVDYGLWFNDSLNTRQGVREAARQGVVQTPGCTTGSNDLAKLACTTRQQVGAAAGTTYAMVKAPNGWAKGEPLIVCAMVRAQGVTGLTPLPNDRMVRSRTQLSIEVDFPLPSGASATAASSYADPPPAGQTWTWCAS